MALILEGTLLAKKIRTRVRQELDSLVPNISRPPHLVVFLSHPDPASTIYVRNKLLACQEAGVLVTVRDEPLTTTDDLIEKISLYNLMDDVDGILIQTPVHPDIDLPAILQTIDPAKDVDGATPENLGKLLLSDRSGFVPCTPLGIQRFFVDYDIPLERKHVVIVGRSTIVGKPLALLLSQKGPFSNATVTLAHSKSKNLTDICKEADVIVAAAGSPKLITPDFVKEGAIVIDVGINRIVKDGKNVLVGDVDFEKVSPICSAITPVPGGVGPMTIAALLVNVLKSYSRRNNVYL